LTQHTIKAKNTLHLSLFKEVNMTKFFVLIALILGSFSLFAQLSLHPSEAEVKYLKEKYSAIYSAKDESYKANLLNRLLDEGIMTSIEFNNASPFKFLQGYFITKKALRILEDQTKTADQLISTHIKRIKSYNSLLSSHPEVSKLINNESIFVKEHIEKLRNALHFKWPILEKKMSPYLTQVAHNIQEELKILGDTALLSNDSQNIRSVVLALTDFLAHRGARLVPGGKNDIPTGLEATLRLFYIFKQHKDHARELPQADLTRINNNVMEFHRRAHRFHETFLLPKYPRGRGEFPKYSYELLYPSFEQSTILLKNLGKVSEQSFKEVTAHLLTSFQAAINNAPREVFEVKYRSLLQKSYESLEKKANQGRLSQIEINEVIPELEFFRNGHIEFQCKKNLRKQK